MNRRLIVEQILDLARWAPSGDNTQPWRFEIVSDDVVIVHGFDTRDHCVYDLDGRPSQLALGALLETMRIAATAHGLRTAVTQRSGLPDETPTFEVHFQPDPLGPVSPLIPFIKNRSVQRRPLSTRPMNAEQKAALEASVAPDYRVIWFETAMQRWRVAMLMFRNAKLRLTMREAFEVHRTVIEWGARFSEDKIPGQAVGADPFTMALMRWVMRSWSRVEFFNTWLGGTLIPRLQLDLIPGVACAAHFGLVARTEPVAISDYIAAGQALQRFWLEATRRGLLLQPEMTPIIFARYHRNQTAFSASAAARALCARISLQFESLLQSEGAPRTVFFGRIGMGSTPRARSTRLPLARLTRIHRSETVAEVCNDHCKIPTDGRFG